MSLRNVSRTSQLRTRIAKEAARLMVEDGIRDYAMAKRKAAAHLQVADLGMLPGNHEIEQARHEYQRLFHADSQPRRLEELRRAALEAMRFLARFQPCLVGPVLEGTADRNNGVILHLFAEPPEEVGFFLLEQRIPFTLCERRLRISPDETRVYPGYCFVAGEIALELIVFPYLARRQAPLSPVDGKPMRRAGLAAVETMAREDRGP
jgi:hypothetical protein